MEKGIEYYMDLPYRVEVEKDGDSDGYMASIPLLKGCMTCGGSAEEVLMNLEDAKRAWLETAIERKIAIPEPV